MFTQEKIKREDSNKSKEAMSMITQMERYFAALELKYHIYLFVSGICLLLVFGKLGWAAGIGWFFFSKFVAMILMKIESWKVESEVMDLIKRSSDFMLNNLNLRN